MRLTLERTAMIRNFIYQIEKEYDGMSIRDYLKSLGYPHAVFIRLKKTPDSILLNGVWVYVTTILHTGDTLSITLVETEGSKNILPVFLPLSVCYEDEDILVVNKPAHMPVHPSIGHHEHTLANVVLGYYEKQDIPYTFRCVNRLDRDTTGLTILAKHMLSSAILSTQISRREISREYLAIVEGLTPDFGTVDAPIARKSDSTIERQVDFARGETAVTHYRRLAYKNGLSLLSLHLETGRTHQIRVHMKYIGHPLIGDFLYNPESRIIKRQALHAHRLQFTHPITGEFMDFSVPLAEDMAAAFPDFSAS